VSAKELEQALRDLPRTGKLIKHRDYRQVWRFECAAKPYYLKFYPRGALRDRLCRWVRGSKALMEFQRLQWLQKAAVPAPRAVASLLGFTIAGVKGDAVILEGIEPSLQLDQYFNQHELHAQAVPNHIELAKQLIDLLEKLGRAGLGHSDLHLGNMLLKDGRLYLVDGYEVHKGGLHLHDIFLLALSASPYATRTDFYRAWQQLGPGGPLPPANARAPVTWRKLMARSFKKDRYFGHLKSEEWRGHFFRHAKFPHRWSPASRMDITEKDWHAAWPLLLQQIASDQFQVLKRSPSGDVLAGEIVLGGRPVPVVVKKPIRKYWYRYINEIGRGSRSRRAWTKAWKLVVRHIPTAWPLLLMEKRRLGYVTDSLVVFERIAGQPLSSPDWSAKGPEQYHNLLHRAGRLLRQLEDTGLFLYDAKADNWIVRDDPKLGPMPMLIDMDGIRRFKVSIGGFNRLLRSLRENPAVPFTTDDALALARGYEPSATTRQLYRLCGLKLDSPTPPQSYPAKEGPA